MDRKSKIFVAGGTGMVGSAIIRKLVSEGFSNIVSNYHQRVPSAEGRMPARFLQLDLKRQAEVEEFLRKEKPSYVFLAAAKVGGILANNTYPADFIYDNLMIQTNVIHGSYKSGVSRLLFLGSSCIYPKFAPQPMKEEHLLTGVLEPTNEPYAVAKIAGIKMCQSYNRQYGTAYISVMPTNLYGPQDNFDLETSHVLPAMIRKFHEARQAKEKGEDAPVVLWGTGSPRREFLHVDDLAAACLHVMLLDDDRMAEILNSGHPLINIGTGKDITILELALLIREIVGYDGPTVWDSDKPDGTPRKLLDVSRLEGLGWKAGISLRDGIKQTYDWYLRNK